MSNLLEEIVKNKRLEIARAETAIPREAILECLEPSERDFRAALAGGRDDKVPRLIAEVKRRSPSKKSTRELFDITDIVQKYNEYAVAISVLTDQKYFGGSLEDLSEVDIQTALPILRKDFIVHEYQLLEARHFGADAVLLIAAILEANELESLIIQARDLGMDALVEVHTAAELEKVLATSAEMIGINNRNLDTLKINLETTHALVARIPNDKIIVSESGIASAEDVQSLAGKVDAILVGTSILGASNIEEKLRELTFVGIRNNE